MTIPIVVQIHAEILEGRRIDDDTDWPTSICLCCIIMLLYIVLCVLASIK